MNKRQIIPLTEISSRTYTRFFKELYKKIETNYKMDYFKVGGENTIVDIDISKCWKKNTIEKEESMVFGYWVLGMVERGGLWTTKTTTIAKRDTDTITSECIKNIDRRSHIYSDCWHGYTRLGTTFAGHSTVNRSINYPGANTRVHTNTMEGIWAAIKEIIP